MSEENRIFVSLKVDKTGILGKIAKANALGEELKITLRELERLVLLEESRAEEDQLPRKN